MMKRIATLGLSLSFLFVLSCGSDSGSTGTKLDANKQVKLLDDSEKKVLKEELAEKKGSVDTTKLAKGICAYMGVLQAQLDTSKKCEDLAKECETTMAAEMEKAMKDTQSDEEFNALVESCGVEVGQMTQCIDDTMKALNTAFDGVSCSSTMEDIQKRVENLVKIESCKFTENCKLATEAGEEMSEALEKMQPDQQPVDPIENPENTGDGDNTGAEY